MYTDKELFNEKLKTNMVNRKEGYIEAVLQTCDELGIDPSTVSKFISRPMKEKIRAEGEANNILPRSAKLPLS
jgi:hypothetical protein